MTENNEKMATLERELEKRFEKMCEKNGWIASANFLYGTETASMMLEKFSKEPVSPDDVRAAHMAINGFIIAELGIPYIVDNEVFTEDEERIPNTIAPYHFTIHATIDAANWIKRAA